MADDNRIDESGIHIQTYDQVVAEIVDGTPDVPGLRQIYGADINVDQNSPDGQLVGIFALSKIDVLDLIVQDYDSKDPDQAVGVALDAVSQLCGISRKGGSYTETDVVVTTDRDINLTGLDDPSAVPFTVADSTGNKFNLIDSASLTTGENVLAFRAAELGQVQVLANTLTVPVTIILGVVSVNNPDGPYQDGANQETDAQFRIRRQKSVSAPAQGYLQALYGGLNDITGLVGAAVYENVTGSEDGDGIPGHSIWVVVDGGEDQAVAEAIYKYRNAGCGMKGDEDVVIVQVDGSDFHVFFDRATEENLYVQFHLDTIGGSYDADAIKQFLVDNYVFGINQYADITTLATLIRASNPNVVVSDAGVSNDDSSFPAVVYPTTKDKKFVLLAENIEIT